MCYICHNLGWYYDINCYADTVNNNKIINMSSKTFKIFYNKYFRNEVTSTIIVFP